MKLATVATGSRDGRLVVVSRNGRKCVAVPQIAETLQFALDNWARVEPLLQAVYHQLNSDENFGEVLDVSALHSPLPRAYEWIDGSAYINHIILVRKARNAEPPATLRTDPLVYQGGSGTFLRPTEPIAHPTEDWGIDFEAEVCAITDDVPYGTRAENAAAHIKLFCLCNDVSLRRRIPAELEKGFGFFVSKPSTAFSPFAVTPDELGAAWHDGRVNLPMHVEFNGAVFGTPDAGGHHMHFSFAELIQHVTQSRALTAGTIVGSGTVSNEAPPDRGSCCLAEKRMLEKINTGAEVTPFMRFGDRVTIRMAGLDGADIFGVIDQTVVQRH